MSANMMETRGAVVITGASTGIGKVCALYLDRLGFRVFAGVRREEDGNVLRKEASDRMTPVFIDVIDSASIDSALKFISGEVGGAGLAGLVNNAGISIGGLLEFLPIAEIRRQLEVNVIGHIAVTQALLPLLRKGRGRIVNMGSIAGRMPQPYLGPYSASKAALEAVTDSLRMELRPLKIPVSIIEPGVVYTPMWEKARIGAHITVENFPQEAFDLYGSDISAVTEVLENKERIQKVAVSVDVVAKAVAHALTAKKPKTRYIVGWDAKLGAFLARFLPDRLLDWLTMIFWRELGLKKTT
ncbi:MAG: SDR family NAD(P)-dependent oxidoreductase [Thermodesulfobacteriota bacterium]|nr:SDR family NAD(P)-dependent oxidoreductase [Thermodesulfobacteriota bacterium]